MASAPRFQLNFTQKALEALPVPATGRTCHHDAKTPGLLLAITANGCRSFQVYRKLNGKPVRVTLGRFPPMTVEQARKRAATVHAQMVSGVHPIAARRANHARLITLRDVLHDYLKARTLKPKTQDLYRWWWKTRPALLPTGRINRCWTSAGIWWNVATGN